MVNTHIGECAIHLEGGRDVVFRPTFFRVAQLGSPKEILELFELIQVPGDEGFKAAYRVLYTFADSDDIDDVIGYFYPAMRNGRLYFKYKHGKCPPEDLHVIGCKLLTDALVGRPSERERKIMADEKKAEEFDPAEFVAIGDGLLGGRDWWQATKIELDKAIKAKYPPKPEDDKQTKEDQRRLFEEIDRLKREKGLLNGS